MIEVNIMSAIDIDIKELEKQRDKLNAKINEYYELKTKTAIIENAGYVGKTFKKSLMDDMTGYYKILSVDINNQYRMNTLVFTLSSKPFISMHDTYDDDAIMFIDSIGWFCNDMINYNKPSREIDTYVEISNEEYQEAFNLLLEKIKGVIDNV